MLQQPGRGAFYRRAALLLALGLAVQLAASPLAHSESNYDGLELLQTASGETQQYDADDDDGGDYERDGGEGGDEPEATELDEIPLFGNWSSSEGQSSEEVALFLEFIAELLRRLNASKSQMNVSTALALSNARVQDRRLCNDTFFQHFFGVSACGGQQRIQEIETDVKPTSGGGGGGGGGHGKPSLADADADGLIDWSLADY